MYPETLPTDSPEALRSFINGREAFDAYLESGRSDALERADKAFGRAEAQDPRFHLAKFFHAVTLNELRDHPKAIEHLTRLSQEDVEFSPEVHLHLGYAYTKLYENKDYPRAKDELDLAANLAQEAEKRSLLPIIEAYRIFLYAVLSGRGDKKDRETFSKQALDKGQRLLNDASLKNSPDYPAIQSELHNALGITHMRKGEREKPFSPEAKECWRKAEDHYRKALELGLGRSLARVMQNQGTLRKIRGDQFRAQDKTEEAETIYSEAIDLYERSIQLNPRDQFPHYRLAELNARLRRWSRAEQALKRGRQEKGSVQEKDWQRVEAAIREHEISLLDQRRS